MNQAFASRSRDNVLLMTLAEAAEPSAYDKVMLGALLMRYQHDPGFLANIHVVVKAWKLTPKGLYEECRAIWANGFRPEDTNLAGSSWDANTTEEENVDL